MPLSPADHAFLATYDPSIFPRPSVAVDAVVLTCQPEPHPHLKLLVYPRVEPPFAGLFALPGGFVGIDEPLDAAMARVLAKKAGLSDLPLEQLHTFGDPGRDPRMRVISITYLALVPPERLTDGPVGATLIALGADGPPEPLAFDHTHVVRFALHRLRNDVDVLAFRLVSPRFTLRQLQTAHEAILGMSLNKDSFRRRLLATGWLVPTGERQAGVEHRPAELYTLNVPGGPHG